MQEIDLMQQALEVVLEYAKRANASRVTEVQIRVGGLLDVTPVSLSFAFGIVTEGTIVEEARLDIERAPVVYYCRNCEKEFTPEGTVYTCPDCGQVSTDIRRGREFEVVSIEVD